MEMTQNQQRLAFVVIVLVLVGLGAYLIEGHNSGSHAAASPTPTPSPTASAPAPSASASAPTDVPPSVVPAATPVSTAGGAEIYQWLPFTASGLLAAAQATSAFATDYVTWNYHESGAAYTAKMASLVEASQLTLIQAGYEAPGEVQQRAADKQVSTGSGSIQSINSFSGTGPTITFVVAITQKVTSTQPASTQTTQWWITMVQNGNSWQVHNFQPAGQGDQ